MSSTFRLKPHQLFIFSVLSLFILILFFPISLAYTAQVTLAWDPNTEPELAGYKIYYGLLSDQYSSSVDVGNQTSYTLSNLPDGKTYYMAATAYDREGYESDFSNEVVFNAPPPCTYSVSPVSQSFGPEGGSSTVNVTATSGCNWTAVSNASWLVITSNSSITGNGTVNYSASSNSSASMRTGTLTVAGQSVTVTQSGVPQYTLSITKAGTGSGTVTNNPTGPTFGAGTVVTLTATTDSSSTFAGWSGGCTGTSPTCTVTMNGNTSVTATFTLKTYTIMASAGSNGSISPKGSVTVSSGASQAFTITPNANYKIADVKVDGVSKGAITSYTFQNVTANHSISASFTILSYTITASAGSNGSIYPKGNVTVSYGGSKTFMIIRNLYYKVADVKVDGVSKGAITSYTFKNVTSSHSISATFVRK